MWCFRAFIALNIAEKYLYDKNYFSLGQETNENIKYIAANYMSDKVLIGETIIGYCKNHRGAHLNVSNLWI